MYECLLERSRKAVSPTATSLGTRAGAEEWSCQEEEGGEALPLPLETERCCTYPFLEPLPRALLMEKNPSQGEDDSSPAATFSRSHGSDVSPETFAHRVDPSLPSFVASGAEDDVPKQLCVDEAPLGFEAELSLLPVAYADARGMNSSQRDTSLPSASPGRPRDEASEQERETEKAKRQKAERRNAVQECTVREVELPVSLSMFMAGIGLGERGSSSAFVVSASSDSVRVHRGPSCSATLDGSKGRQICR